MGILDKQNKKKKLAQDKINKVKKENKLKKQLTTLTPNELKYLLQVISKADFKGAELQMIFTITAKLQNILKQTE